MYQFVRTRLRQVFCRHNRFDHWDLDIVQWHGMRCQKCGKEWICFRSLQIPHRFNDEER
mgnify:CR=1 FL=1